MFPSPWQIQQAANLVWFCFDVVIVVQKFMYGRKEFRLLPFLGVVCFVYDIAYIVLLVRQYRREGLTVLTRRPVVDAEHRPASRDTMVSAVAPDAPGPRGTEQEEAEPAGPALVDQSIREERAHE